MCILCGEFVMQVHWTDRKQENQASTSVIVGDDQLRERQRARIHRVRLSNQILQYYGLRLEDWSGSKYILRDRKGSSTIVHDLGGLWPAVEKMIRQPLDPLDSSLITALTNHQMESGGDRQ